MGIENRARKHITLQREKSDKQREEKKKKRYSKSKMVINDCDTGKIKNKDNVSERERRVKTNFPWLVKDCYTVHQHPH